jgi:hypothetical protein
MSNIHQLDLDISWIEKQEKFHHIDRNYFREPMEKIHTYFIYTDLENYIEKITCELQNIDTIHNGHGITKEKLLQIIQKKKIYNTKKYRLLDVIIYNVDLEPQQIQSYVNNENYVDISKTYFKSVSFMTDILISPSIFIFHSVNAIYFVFQQIENVDKHPIKSILKTAIENDPSAHLKKTKKVKIVDQYNEIHLSRKNATTRRNYSIK